MKVGFKGVYMSRTYYHDGIFNIGACDKQQDYAAHFK